MSVAVASVSSCEKSRKKRANADCRAYGFRFPGKIQLPITGISVAYTPFSLTGLSFYGKSLSIVGPLW